MAPASCKLPRSSRLQQSKPARQAATVGAGRNPELTQRPRGSDLKRDFSAMARVWLMLRAGAIRMDWGDWQWPLTLHGVRNNRYATKVGNKTRVI